MSIGAGDLKKEAIFENPKCKPNFDFIDAMGGNEYNVAPRIYIDKSRVMEIGDVILF